VWMSDGGVAVSQSLSDMVGRQLGRLTPGLALVIDTLSLCEPLEVDVLCDVVRREDLEVAEQMHLVTVERDRNKLMARLAHPLFGELRRAGSVRSPTATCAPRCAGRCCGSTRTWSPIRSCIGKRRVTR